MASYVSTMCVNITFLKGCQMKKIIVMLVCALSLSLGLVSVCLGKVPELCEAVRTVVPPFLYDAEVVGVPGEPNSFRIVNVGFCYVGQKAGQGIAMCSPEDHDYEIKFYEPLPEGFLVKRKPSDPNVMFIGFIPQTPGVHYILFGTRDKKSLGIHPIYGELFLPENRVAMLYYATIPTAPRVKRIFQLEEWPFKDD